VTLYRWIYRKNILTKRIAQYVPRGHIYVEPFADAISLLWYLPRPFPVEVINDLYNDIVSIYRILQDKDNFDAIVNKIKNTPFSHDYFERAVKIINESNVNNTDKAWAFFVIHNHYLFDIINSFVDTNSYLLFTHKDIDLSLIHI